MNKAILFLIPLLLFLYGGCSNDENNSNFICTLEQAQERFASTMCIAEELVNGCTNIACDSTTTPDITEGNFDTECSVIDCETLACDSILIQNGGSSFVSGLITELAINEINELPFGLFVIDEMETPFNCILIAF